MKELKILENPRLDIKRKRKIKKEVGFQSGSHFHSFCRKYTVNSCMLAALSCTLNLNLECVDFTLSLFSFSFAKWRTKLLGFEAEANPCDVGVRPN